MESILPHTLWYGRSSFLNKLNSWHSFPICNFFRSYRHSNLLSVNGYIFCFLFTCSFKLNEKKIQAVETILQIYNTCFCTFEFFFSTRCTAQCTAPLAALLYLLNNFQCSLKSKLTIWNHCYWHKGVPDVIPRKL